MSDSTVSLVVTFSARGKKLFDGAEFSSIVRFDGETRARLYELCLPSPLRAGVYQLPLALIPDVQRFLEQRAAQRLELIDHFTAAYVAGARSAGNGHLSVSNVRDKFSFSWNWVKFETPDALASVGVSFFEAERAKLQRQAQEVDGEIRLLLRERFRDLVSRVVDRLTPTATGRAKKFHASLITNLANFLSTLESRNVTNDEELRELQVRAQIWIPYCSAADLRSNDERRSRMLAEFTELQEWLNRLVGDGPVVTPRKVSMECFVSQFLPR